MTVRSAHMKSEEMKITNHGHGVGTFDVHELPEIVDDGGADRAKREEADHLAPERAGEEGAGEDEPRPPRLGEGAVAELVELDVGENGERHEEDEGSVEEDQARLGDVEVVL